MILRTITQATFHATVRTYEVSITCQSRSAVELTYV